VNRALDIAEDDLGSGEVRKEILDMLMRYLDTDSLLCWAPAPETGSMFNGRESLRDIQRRNAEKIVGYLTTVIWPGVEIRPVLEEGSILPTPQPRMTRDVIRGWVTGLPAWELAGLERAVLAGKGLLGAVRLVVKWSEVLGMERGQEGNGRFGVEEAARAASLEVDWQIAMWGEVEDTHDVDREDLRRQLGSVVLLVSGEAR